VRALRGSSSLLLDYLLVRKGLQPITIESYQSCASRFIKRVRTFTPKHEDVENYVAELYRAGYSHSHKSNSVIAIERWMEYIGDPIRFGRQKKPRPLVKDTLTEAEVTKLIFHCKNIREQAIVSLLAYSGIRNKELCDLRVKDIDFGSNTIRVIKGKGSKEGLAHITGACTNILITYLAQYQRGQDELLFTTLQHNRPYHQTATRKLIKVLCQRSNTKKRVFPHLLRHSLAMNMLLRGAGIYDLKKQLRHVFVDTTLIYVDSIIDGITSAYDKFAPSYV
jgi:site-specific recombinase XerD